MHYIHQHKKIDTATGQLACRVTKSQKPFFSRKYQTADMKGDTHMLSKRKCFISLTLGEYSKCVLFSFQSRYLQSHYRVYDDKTFLFRKWSYLLSSKHYIFGDDCDCTMRTISCEPLGSKFFFFFKKQVPLKYILYNLE